MQTLSKILCITILVLLASCNQAPNPNNAEIQAQLSALHEDVKTLRAELASSNALKDAPEPVEGKPPESELARLNQEVETLSAEVRQMRETVAEMQQVFSLVANGVTTETPSAPPPPAATVVSLDDDPVLGNPEAKIGLIEFSDYECPFCSRFHTQTFPQLKETYIDTGTVQYIFRDLPLDFHTEAKSAAVAANCAGEQGAYWEMYELLYANQRRLGASLYLELAQQLKLNVKKFLACTKNPDAVKEVEADLAYGESVGAAATPSFFVGRVEGDRLVDAQIIIGAQPFSVFTNAIDGLLLTLSDTAQAGQSADTPIGGADELLTDINTVDTFKQGFLENGKQVRLVALLSPN